MTARRRACGQAATGRRRAAGWMAARRQLTHPPDGSTMHPPSGSCATLPSSASWHLQVAHPPKGNPSSRPACAPWSCYVACHLPPGSPLPRCPWPHPPTHLKSTTAMGLQAAAAGEERERYVSFRALTALGRSTGRPLRKKNWRSPAGEEGSATGGGGLRKTHRRSPGCSPGGGVEGGGATERTWGLEGAVQAAKPQCPPSPKPSTALPPPGHPHATHSRTPPPVPTRRLPPEDRPLAAAALDTQPAMVMGTPPSSTSTCSGSTPSAALLPNTVRMLSLRTITRGKTSVRSGKMAAAGRRGVPRWLALCPARRSPPPPPPVPPGCGAPSPGPPPSSSLRAPDTNAALGVDHRGACAAAHLVGAHQPHAGAAAAKQEGRGMAGEASSKGARRGSACVHGRAAGGRHMSARRAHALPGAHPPPTHPHRLQPA